MKNKIIKFSKFFENNDFEDDFEIGNNNDNEKYDLIENFKSFIMKDGLEYVIMDSARNGKTTFNFEDKELINLLNQFIIVRNKIYKKLDW